MQQFLSSISFCLKNIGYLFILCLPVMTLEIALVSLVASLDIESSSDTAALEAIGEISAQVSLLVLASLVLSVALSGGCMVAFRSLSNDGQMSPYQALFSGLKKFFPLLWSNILHSIAYGLGFLMLILPGFYLYGRLGLFPLFIMFEDKGVMDSFGESWNLTEEFATKLFTLTAIFMSIQLSFGFLGGLMGFDGILWFLIASTAVKYGTLMPLFYLYFSLYESVKNKSQLRKLNKMKILVMGLPGSGKTYLTQRLVPLLNAAWYNADQVRKMSNDWDFSDEGRKRQSMRMKAFADFEKSHGRYVVCDFVCPTTETRENFDADLVIWMDTIKEGRYEDTNKLFQNPDRVDFHITEWNEHNHDDVAKEILKNV